MGSLIKEGLKEFADDNGLTGFTNQDFEDMSWVGLEDTKDFDKKFNVKRDNDFRKQMNYTAPDGSKSYSKEYYNWSQNIQNIQKNPKGNLRQIGAPKSGNNSSSGGSGSKSKSEETPDGGKSVPSF